MVRASVINVSYIDAEDVGNNFWGVDIASAKKLGTAAHHRGLEDLARTKKVRRP